jgi:secreted trypsin-like serine protease
MKTFSIFSLIAAALFSHSAHALMAGAPDGSPADSPQMRVDANTADSPWAGVGSIVISGKIFSGALISPRHVLTAAHVVHGVQPGGVNFNLNAGGNLSHQFSASAIYVNPGYQGFLPSNDGVVHDDLAIIELNQAVPLDIPVYSLHETALAPATELHFVGYGASGSGAGGAFVGGSSSVKRIGANVADLMLVDDDGGPQAEVFVFDFDGPTPSSNRLGGISLGNATETTFGVGDSGLPAFVMGDGGWEIAGVGTFVANLGGVSLPAGSFGTGGGGMLVSAYADWIHTTVTPVPEPSSAHLMLLGLSIMGLGLAHRKKRP